MIRTYASVVIFLCTFSAYASEPNATELPEQASQALRKASEFFRNRVAVEGGYVWQYSEDLTKREGEGRASKTKVWVQPPGTPSVGMAFLEAYHATGDRYYLEAAKKAGDCLVRGQLKSGGWQYHVEFDPKRRTSYAYRVDAASKGRDETTLDDDTTQSALRLLMRLDKALEFKDTKIHEAAEYALASLLDARFPNGAWPQRYSRSPDAEKFPVKKADYPESWSRTWPKEKYKCYYTFNDGAIIDVIDVMFEAWHTYGDERYRTAAKKAGDFILLAQMPEPQPGWAQQYDAQMHPAWARKFEPPAVCGGESQEVLEALLQLYRETGSKKYLEPVPKAIAYFRRSMLPNGRLARFYELKTNKPLYFTKQYELTYLDDDMPTHYSFIVGAARLDSVEQEYNRLLDSGRKKPDRQPAGSHRKPSKKLIARTKAVISALDEQGRWVNNARLKYHGPDDPTRRVIRSDTFIKNVGVLSRYLSEIKPAKNEKEAYDWVVEIQPGLRRWLLSRRVPDKPWGRVEPIVTNATSESSIYARTFHILGMLDELKPEERREWADYIQSFQDPKTGGGNIRDMLFGVESLGCSGLKYPVRVVPHYKDRDELVARIEKLPWQTSPYRAGNYLSRMTLLSFVAMWQALQQTDHRREECRRAALAHLPRLRRFLRADGGFGMIPCDPDSPEFHKPSTYGTGLIVLALAYWLPIVDDDAMQELGWHEPRWTGPAWDAKRLAEVIGR